jgi:hypothetical protein
MSRDPVKRNEKSKVPFEFMVLLALICIAFAGKLGMWLFNWFHSLSR